MAAAFSVIFTIAGWCFGAIDATQNQRQCTPEQQFKDSVTFYQCKTEALRKLTERPPPYIESRFKQKSKTEPEADPLPFCDYLYELETVCLPLYSEDCHPGKAAQVLHGLWVRQELERSLSVFPRDQFFQCNTTHKMLHPNEIAAMREMIKERDWIANSRFCRYLMSYKVSPAPNYWLYSTLRCDGKCDPEDILDIPFRVSPDVNNPPREYRKRVRVMDFRDPGYLSRSMNETIYKYEECLASLGYPDNIQAYVLGDTRETNIQHKMIQDELRSRACSVVTSYVHDCQHLLTRCLSTSSSETIRTQDASWLLSEVDTVMAKISVDWDSSECDVMGGEVSGAGVGKFWISLMFTAFLLMIL